MAKKREARALVHLIEEHERALVLFDTYSGAVPGTPEYDAVRTKASSDEETKRELKKLVSSLPSSKPHAPTRSFASRVHRPRVTIMTQRSWQSGYARSTAFAKCPRQPT